MARIVAEIDESDTPGQRIKTFAGMTDPAGTAQVFARVFVGPNKTEPGVTISKILPASREALLIVVANEAGLKQIWRLRPYGCPDADTPRTAAIRLNNRDVHEVARLLDKLKSAGGQVTTYAAWGGLRITDLPGDVTRMTEIIKEIDESTAPDQKVWFLRPAVMGPPARDLAQFLNRANETNAPERGVTLSKILGDDRANLLIVVGNQTGYHRMTKLSRHICPHGCFGAEDPRPMTYQERLANAVSAIQGDPGGAAALRPGLASKVDRIARVVRALDDAEVSEARRLRVWRINVPGSASELATKLNDELIIVRHARVRVKAIVPSDDDKHLVVVANEAGCEQIKRIHSFGSGPMTTRKVHVRHADVQEMAGVLRELMGDGRQVIASAHKKTIRVTGRSWDVDRIARLVRAVDQPAGADQHVWFVPVKWGLASEMAAKLGEIYPDDADLPQGVKIALIIPDNRRQRLIVVANGRGYMRIKTAVIGCP